MEHVMEHAMLLGSIRHKDPILRSLPNRGTVKVQGLGDRM